MSRFYADISGGRGRARREGHTASGIRAHVHGWKAGVRITGYALEPFGKATGDIFDIWTTGGVGSPDNDRFIGHVMRDEEGNLEFVPSDYCASQVAVYGHIFT